MNICVSPDTEVCFDIEWGQVYRPVSFTSSVLVDLAAQNQYWMIIFRRSLLCAIRHSDWCRPLGLGFIDLNMLEYVLACSRHDCELHLNPTSNSFACDTLCTYPYALAEKRTATLCSCPLPGRSGCGNVYGCHPMVVTSGGWWSKYWLGRLQWHYVVLVR